VSTSVDLQTNNGAVSLVFSNGVLTTYTSDLRLKENIILIGLSALGINIYEFNYINDPDTKYVGVMAQELLGTQFEDAVVIAENGYYAVDYSKIDVKFEKLELA